MLIICRINSILITVVLAVLPLQLFAAESASDSESRLRVLEDREAIRALLVEYGRTLDARDFKGFSELFASGVGEWNGGMGVARGPESIRKLMEQTIGNNTSGTNSPNFHIFSNETINMNGDRATALSKWAFVVQGNDGRPQWVYLGHYDDIFLREEGRWKFLQRKVTSDIPGEKP